MKRMFSTKKMQMLTLMLLCGTTAVMAQNSVGAISVYIAMNNEEQDVKKKIMMVVGACIFLIAAAQALPMFFGLGA